MPVTKKLGRPRKVGRPKKKVVRKSKKKVASKKKVIRRPKKVVRKSKKVVRKSKKKVVRKSKSKKKVVRKTKKRVVRKSKRKVGKKKGGQIDRTVVRQGFTQAPPYLRSAYGKFEGGNSSYVKGEAKGNYRISRGSPIDLTNYRIVAKPFNNTETLTLGGSYVKGEPSGSYKVEIGDYPIVGNIFDDNMIPYTKGVRAAKMKGGKRRVVRRIRIRKKKVGGKEYYVNSKGYRRYKGGRKNLNNPLRENVHDVGNVLYYDGSVQPVELA